MASTTPTIHDTLFFKDTNLIPSFGIPHESDLDWPAFPGTERAWIYCGDNNTIQTRIDAVKQAPIPENPARWDWTARTFFLFDVIRFDRLLNDLNLYVGSISTGIEVGHPKNWSLAELRRAKEQEREEREKEFTITFVTSLRAGVIKNERLIYYGGKYLSDITKFNRIFVSVPEFCQWLVNESNINPEWIPYQVREWAANNSFKNDVNTTKDYDPHSVTNGQSGSNRQDVNKDFDAFDKDTMITVSELVDMAGKFKPTRGDKWVRTRLAEAEVVKCYARKKANEPDGYPRIESIGVITNAGENG